MDEITSDNVRGTLPRRNHQLSYMGLQLSLHFPAYSGSYLGLVSLDDIVANFNISPHTLQRKLKKDGINFQQLADEARKNLAIKKYRK